MASQKDINGNSRKHHAYTKRRMDSHIPKSRLDYWRPKLERNQRRDVENLQSLKALGFLVLVVWECETSDSGLGNRLSAFMVGS